MKILSDYIHSCKSSARMEKKFLMSAGQSYKAKMLFNFYGFKKAYPERRVSTYYFDTVDFDSLRENIDGVNIRDKFRVRYYNNKLSSYRIEIKHKRGDVGYKSVIEMAEKISDKDMLIKNVTEWCSVYIRKRLMASVFVNYNRYYYERDWLRVTFDTNIEAFRVAGSKLLRSSMINYEVVEFKYPVERDDEFRTVYKDLDWMALRNTKSSKYSNALMY